MPPSVAMLAANHSPSTAKLIATLFACCTLLPLLAGPAAAAAAAAAYSQTYTTQIQMGISNPEFLTRQTYFVPDGQCSAQIMPPEICAGSQPLALRVEVTDSAPFPVLQVQETLQTVYLFRGAAGSGKCEGTATVRLLTQC
ncbi:uncharacterized protein LOC121726472 [Aricia agestis]|uniref:uncharacterized protein LOC121726472 n=1 Tax=Aricia agestis TaxID=91739 RepID=UPI001C208861|nr:uncharacterized protein LOC121726472 [Aricia agestis]